MVKVTTNYLIRRMTYGKQLLVRRKDETDKQYLNRHTHLRLQGQFIDLIASNIIDCQAIRVIYLQNNILRSIHSLHCFPQLTYLYLQRNLLTRIENLDGLVHLKKLYLGYNEISVVEGMEGLPNVTEIHMQCQSLPLGGTLYCEPRTLLNLQNCLEVLNISNNRLTSLRPFAPLTNLVYLNAADNLVSEVSDITSALLGWPFIRELDLNGNPVSTGRKYRDVLIASSKSLATLDGKPIHDNTRKYVEKLFERRKARGKVVQSDDVLPLQRFKTVKFADFTTAAANFPLPKFLEMDLSKSNLFPAWALRKNVNSVNQSALLPRPFWKKGGTAPKPRPYIDNTISFQCF